MNRLTERDLHPEQFDGQDNGVQIAEPVIWTDFMAKVMRAIFTAMICLVSLAAMWYFTGGDSAPSRMPVAFFAISEVLAVFFYVISRIK